MSFIYSQALAEASLPASYLDTEQSAQSSGSLTPKPCLWHDKTMEHSRLSRFGMTCKPLTEDLGTELLTSWRAGFRAKTSALPETARGLTESAAECGTTWPGSLARLDRATSSWKTAQLSLLGDWDEFSQTWPRWGLMRNGECWERPTLAPRTGESGSGLWQTPVADDAANRAAGKWNSRGEPKLSAQVLYATPRASDHKGATSPEAAGKAIQRGHSPNLPEQIAAVEGRMWPTATTTAFKGWSPNHNRANTDDRLDYTVEREAFSPGQQTPPMRLNPDWVEVLMGWPNEMTSLNPISSVKMCFWLMGFCDDEKTGRTQVLRVLREGNAAKEIRAAIGRPVCISEAAFLLHELCEYANRPYEARIFMACAETLEGEMRSVRLHEGITGAPHRPGQGAQRPEKHTDSMQALSRLLAHHGQEAWENGSWEDGIPRVVDGVAHRSHRIKAIGNGQVPRVAAAAWHALSQT